jgi:hypothetical protein
VKWVADDKLAQYRPQLEALLLEESLDLQMFLGTVAALDRLDGKEPSDRPSPERLLARIADERSSPAVRRLALRLIDPAHKPLTLAQLEPFVSHADAALRLEAVRTLAAHHDEARFALLERIARDEQQSIAVRAAAIAGLAPAASAHADSLLEMARGENRPLRDEALRSLIGVELTDRQRAALGEMEAVDIHSSEAIKRVLGRPLVERPAADDTVSWIATLPRRVDPQAGERIFFGHKLGACAKCHQVEGRGNAVGPSLTLISRRLDSLRASLPPQAKQDGAAAAAQAEAEKRWLLETILQPSREMAPQYTPWQIVTTDGRLLTGLPRRKGGNQEAYLGLDGKEFTIKKSDIEISRELDKSIMPDDVLRTLTPQEIGDLLAFLMQTPS